ncbi:hypothetical protein [Xenorhabdus doucetiae]|uniref:Uncharacterized protein n=1 Tax=Xenorhabdus doucetiae TaxID=351671 RepID=A0A068QTW5_9GAMM|nr:MULTISPECIES: hypothetical protein [Xenorhabdus]MBD2783670.1 hypothetical protein [Xenorhabdus sp. 3]MBD2789657.1 hypothetical protein [Xenorhabdus sp. DI]TYP05642.1 hypothetical protein LY16_02010 [Xenorhabdus doucetiae]CDG18096.1 protein of unknown function [Xenorhabdus doucetiae]
MKELTDVKTNLALSEKSFLDLLQGIDNIGKLLKDIFQLLMDSGIIPDDTLIKIEIKNIIDIAISGFKEILTIIQQRNIE